MAQQQANIRRAIYLSLLMILFGSTASAATKFVADTVPTMAIVCVQYGISLLFCLPATLKHGIGSLKTEHAGLHLVRGLFGVSGFYLYYAALAHIPLMDAMLLRQSAPLTVPLVMWLWQRQRVPAYAWWPIVLGFIGVIIILRPGTGLISWWHFAGFISAVTLAGSMVTTYTLARTESSNQILFYYFALSFLCVLPLSATDLAAISVRDWFLLVYIGVSMYVALWLYTVAYSIAAASTIAPINYLAVVMAGILGWIIWQDVPDSASVLGSLLVIGGGLLTIYQAKKY